MTSLEQSTTPAALVDAARMQRKGDRTQLRMKEVGVKSRPHVGTAKCAEIVRAQAAAGTQDKFAKPLALRQFPRCEAPAPDGTLSSQPRFHER
ncbi:hypothetical protein [Variovorax sp. Root434]|uniref:hypothetical protein n=1 Tax=Variovorax sp. Root434 TaxID=1736536 RepID=UPI0012F87274|nr:hypothetical protein [Variovorax sp. Root434]